VRSERKQQRVLPWRAAETRCHKAGRPAHRPTASVDCLRRARGRDHPRRRCVWRPAPEAKPAACAQPSGPQLGLTPQDWARRHGWSGGCGRPDAARGTRPLQPDRRTVFGWTSVGNKGSGGHPQRDACWAPGRGGRASSGRDARRPRSIAARRLTHTGQLRCGGAAPLAWAARRPAARRRVGAAPPQASRQKSPAAGHAKQGSAGCSLRQPRKG
jgi:hypothetical protein